MDAFVEEIRECRSGAERKKLQVFDDGQICSRETGQNIGVAGSILGGREVTGGAEGDGQSAFFSQDFDGQGLDQRGFAATGRAVKVEQIGAGDARFAEHLFDQTLDRMDPELVFGRIDKAKQHGRS